MVQQTIPIPASDLSVDEVRDLILSVGHHHFEVVFTKRSGGRRVMRAQLGEYKGGKKSLDMARNNLLPVIDVEAGGWRSIPLDSVISFRLLAVKVV